jgi:hypothetical protein
MSEYQIAITKMLKEQGIADTIDIMEKALNIYLPEHAWKGNTPMFLLAIGSENPLHLRLRRDFFDAIGVDLRVKLKYSSVDFMSILMEFCRMEQLDVTMLIGTEWNLAPKDNYVFGVLMMLTACNMRKNMYVEAAMDTMRLVPMNGVMNHFENKMIGPVSLATNAFSKYKKDKEVKVKDGTVIAARFGPEADHFMQQLKPISAVTQCAQGLMKSNKTTRLAAKEAFFDKRAQTHMRNLGITKDVR